MSKIQRDVEEFDTQPLIPSSTKKQLQAIDIAFRECNMDEYVFMKKYGAMTEDSAVIIPNMFTKKNRAGENYWTYTPPCRFEYLKFRLKEWYKWQNKINYAIQKSLEGLQTNNDF